MPGEQLGLELEGRIERDFRAFHRRHPEVYRILCSLALRAIDRGKTKIGIAMLWEVMRWEAWLGRGVGDEPFKLNNNYRSRYARLLMEREPALAGVFETRELRTR